jgi:hypothetical protein
MLPVSDHARNERLSLAYHRAVVGAMRQDPSVLDRARARVAAWGETGSVHSFYVEAWQRVFEGSADEMAALLLDEGERATALRQVSPFAGVLSPRERWAIWRQGRGDRLDP